MLIDHFPLPSVSLLQKIQAGGVDAVKAIKLLREKGEISDESILIFDEMYLQKEEQYSSGEMIGRDENGSFYNGIVVFMIVGLKKSIPFVVKSCPKTTLSGNWLSKEILSCIEVLNWAGFDVRGIVCDNHPANVNAFKDILSQFPSSEDQYWVIFPSNGTKKTYVFFDNVHLVKNVRNNLFGAKKFVFGEFSFEEGQAKLEFPAGYISWGDIHRIYDLHSKLPAFCARHLSSPINHCILDIISKVLGLHWVYLIRLLLQQ